MEETDEMKMKINKTIRKILERNLVLWSFRNSITVLALRSSPFGSARILLRLSIPIESVLIDVFAMFF